MAGEVIADLVVNIAGNDIQLVQATRSAAEAMEQLAKQGVSMSANIKYAFTETGVQAESMSVKIQESAEGSTRAMTAMTGTLRGQLQSLNLTMRELATNGEFTRGTSEQLAQMSRQAEAAKALAKQAESEIAAAARETAQQRAAYEKEAVEQAEMAARERIAIERDVVAQINLAERDRVAVERAVDEEIAAMNKMFATQTIATIKQVAAERKAADAVSISSSTTSAKVLKELGSVFGDVGGIVGKFPGIFKNAGEAMFGAGSTGAAAAGVWGAAIGAATSAAKVGIDAVAAALGLVWDVSKRVGEGILALGTVSVIAAAKFDQLMLRTVTMAQAPMQGAADGLEHMKQAVLDLSGEVGKTPDEMAKALYHIESLGYRGSDAMEVLRRSAQEAAMSGANLEDVATAMGAIFRIAFKDVHDAADAASYLNAITGIGNMTMQGLTSAIGTGILPVLKEAGLGMRDFGAAIALATDNAEPANQAATKLRQTIAMIETAPLQQKKIDMFASIGMQADQMAKDLLKPDGLSGAVHDLKDHLEKAFGPDAINQLKTYAQVMDSDGTQAAEDWAASNSKAAQVVDQIFGGARSGGFINMLLSETDQLDKNYAKIGDEQQRNTRFAQSWAEQQKQLSQQWKDFKATVESVAVRIGEKLMPSVQRFGKDIGDFFHALGQVWSSDKAVNIPQEFMDNLRKLKEDFFPWLEKRLASLRDWLIVNKDKLDEVAHFVSQRVLPALEDLAKLGIDVVIEGIKNVITFISNMTEAWERHSDTIRGMLKLLVNEVFGFAYMILDAFEISFGWLPMLHDKFEDAKKELEKFQKDANKIIDDITSVKPIEVYGYFAGPAFSPGTGKEFSGYGHGDYFSPSNSRNFARAEGGPVESNHPYIVGENGPELLYLNTNGYVVPNHQLATHIATRTSPSGMTSLSSAGSGVALVDAHVYLDGRELYNSVIQLSQRHKMRNGSTGVT